MRLYSLTMTTTVGYHASHEQFPPGELVGLARAAEQAGFTAALSSDHFHPWSRKQGESGFAWAWLGAAMQATRLTFGVVNAPGQRYHPAIIAQAAATLAEMFPDRLWVAQGSGQAVNEAITGDVWPDKAQRNARLLECVQVMRALWAGERVTHRGLVTVDDATLFTRPARPPRIIGAAITAETAEWVGSWADGLITVSRPPEQLAEVVRAFRRGGGDGKPMYLKVQLSFARDDQQAVTGALAQWATNIFASSVLTDLRRPEQFDELAAVVTPELIRQHVRISADPEQHLAWLAEDVALGFEGLYLHNVNLDQRAFIDAFGAHVVPELAKLTPGG